MLKKLIYLLVILFLLTSNAYALRCGNDVIQIGDSKHKVLNLCGTLIFYDVIGYTKGKIGIMKIEELVYKPTGGYYYYLRFIGNRLVKIESVRY